MSCCLGKGGNCKKIEYLSALVLLSRASQNFSDFEAFANTLVVNTCVSLWEQLAQIP